MSRNKPILLIRSCALASQILKSGTIQQRTDMTCIVFPAAHGARINGLPHLPTARRLNGPFIQVGNHTRGLPIQPAKVEQLASPLFLVGHQFFSIGNTADQ